MQEIIPLTRYLIIKPLFPQGSMLLTKINNIQYCVLYLRIESPFRKLMLRTFGMNHTFRVKYLFLQACLELFCDQ